MLVVWELTRNSVPCVTPAALYRCAKMPSSAAILVVALPGDDEIPVGVHRRRRVLLSVRRIRVHAELGALRDAGGVVTLGVDAVAAAILGVALPGDDEIAVGVHRRRRFKLIARRKGVDEKLGSLHDAGGVVTAGRRRRRLIP